MPVLDPNRNDWKPRDWRHAYDAFLRFKRAVNTVASRIGYKDYTDGWHILFPGKFKGMADPRWQLTFRNIDGQMETVFIGSDAFVARNTIQQLHKQYVSVLATSLRPLPTRKAPSTAFDARYDHGSVDRMRKLWDRMMKVRSPKEWEQLKSAHPEVIAFMKAKAGFLDMTMQQYLYSHPMSKRWPTPPRSKAEMDGRNKQDEDYQRSVERDRSYSDPVDAQPVDTTEWFK